MQDINPIRRNHTTKLQRVYERDN